MTPTFISIVVDWCQHILTKHFSSRIHITLFFSAGMADVVHPAALAMAAGGDDMMGILSPGATGAAALLAVHHVWFNHVKPILDGHTKSA